MGVGDISQQSRHSPWSHTNTQVNQVTEIQSSEKLNGRPDSNEGRPSDMVEKVTPTDKKRKRQSSTSFSSRKKSARVASANDSLGATTTTLTAPTELDLSRTTPITTLEDRRRELRRMRQIRYRQKKNSRSVQVEDDTKQICDEVEQLLRRRRDIYAVIPTKMSVWGVAARYFHIFRYGLQAPAEILKSCTETETQPTAQLDFLISTMASNVVYNAGHGVEAMMEDWESLSRWFEYFDLELEGMVKGPAGSLIATTTTSVTITDRTLRNVFPDLRGGKNGERVGHTNPSLADMLLGHRFVMHGLTYFEWDGVSGRVTSVVSQTDVNASPAGQHCGRSSFVRKIAYSPDFQWKRVK